MLIIMHYRYAHGLLQLLFYVEAFRGFDIFQIDTTKSGLQRFYNLYKFLGIFFIDLNIEYIDVCKNFKQHSLTFHHGLAGLRTNIPQSQHSGSIADDSYQVSFCRVLIYVFFIRSYFLARFCNTGRISKGQISLCFCIFSGDNFNFPRSSF